MPLSLALHHTSKKIKRFIDSRKMDADCETSTMNHGRIIGFIYQNQNREIFQKDIEKEFDIRRSTATNTLKLMEKNGLITRQRTDYDERLKKIILTKKANDIIKKVDFEIQETNKVLERNITPEEKEVFFSVLGKIEQNIKEEQTHD